MAPSITETDLADLAREAGLEVVDAAASRSALANEVTEAIRHYALCHRMDRANAGAGEVKRWASALHRWAEEGLDLHGGTLDDNFRTEKYPQPHSAATMRLVDAWPANGDSSRLEYLLHSAAGHGIYPEDRSMCPDLHNVVQSSAAALELFQLLASSLKERTASSPRETRPTEYARHDLLRTLADLYQQLHGRRLTVVRAAVPNPGRGRDQLPGGPALTWLRSLFALVVERDDDPVMSTLAEWAQKSDALADALREISGKRRKKSH